MLMMRGLYRLERLSENKMRMHGWPGRCKLKKKTWLAWSWESNQKIIRVNDADDAWLGLFWHAFQTDLGANDADDAWLGSFF